MKTALLIIDVQDALCAGEWAMFDIDRVIETINGLSASARRAGVPVVLVQHEEDEGPMQFGSTGQRRAHRRADHRPSQRHARALHQLRAAHGGGAGG